MRVVTWQRADCRTQRRRTAAESPLARSTTPDLRRSIATVPPAPILERGATRCCPHSCESSQRANRLREAEACAQAALRLDAGDAHAARVLAAALWLQVHDNVKSYKKNAASQRDVKSL